MFKFKGSKSQQTSTEVAKSVDDFFSFSKIATLGFPYKPTTLAWEPHLCLMAIGTQYGAIRVYGAPGVQFCGELQQRLSITELIFIPKVGRLISLCSDNSLHLWELNEKGGIWCIEEVKSFLLTGLMKKITVISLDSAIDILYLGTIGGNIYTFNVDSFEMAETVIYQDVVVQNIPDDKKLKQGSVKVISTQPEHRDNLLIGYQQGLIALWDIKKLIVINTFACTQSLESICWQHHGSKFISSYGDGSYVLWNTVDSTRPDEVPMTLYGPFACKAIEKILWKSVKGGEDHIIFSGGMPRSRYGEKNTVTITSGDRHEVLDFSSRVIDFFTIADVFDDSEFDNVHALVILLEEELIAIDLETESWLPFQFPYLEILHSSPITCFQHISEIHKDAWKVLNSINKKESSISFSENAWPIKGGTSIPSGNLANDVLVTGHENGSVKFWRVTSTSLDFVHEVRTSDYFVSIENEEDSDDVEEWPPFRKMGNFDILMDDSRFAVRSLVFNDVSKTLIVAGAAGQILVLHLKDAEVEKETFVSHVTIGDKFDGSLWCNPQPLIVKCGKRLHGKGFHIHCIVQMTPPAAVTSLAYHAEWSLVAAGITHGFLLYDILQKKSVLTRYTLNVSDNSTVISNISPKAKSLRKSFRDSFRKLKMAKKAFKRNRSGSFNSDMQENVSRDSSSMKRDSFTSSPDSTLASSASPEPRSIERDGESSIAADAMNSVQCLYLVQSFIINNVITTPTLWVGTSSGSIYIYTITLPTNDCRTTDAVTCHLGKEVLLKHQAPVIAIRVVDHQGYPLPDLTDVQSQRCKPADLCGSHRVLICTEEQIKVFTLPSMKPFCKNKIALSEGYHIAKVGFSSFPSKTDSKTCEYCVLCLSRSSGLSLYNIPELKKCVAYNFGSTEDFVFAPKTVFSHSGLFVCLNTSSEFEIISSSTLLTAKATCKIELPLDARKLKKKPVAENIVLEMTNIAMQNGPENVHLRGVRDSINVDAQSQTDIGEIDNISEHNRYLAPSTAHSEAHIENQSNGNIESNINNNLLSNQAIPQERRAPLAVIEELNSSDESQLNSFEISSI